MNNGVVHANKLKGCALDQDLAYLDVSFKLGDRTGSGNELSPISRVPVSLRGLWVKQFKALDSVIAHTAAHNAPLKLNPQQIKDLSLFFHRYYLFDPLGSFKQSGVPLYQFQNQKSLFDSASTAQLHAEMTFLKQRIEFYLAKQIQLLFDAWSQLSERLMRQLAFMPALEPTLRLAIVQDLFDVLIQQESEGLVIYHQSVAYRIDALSSTSDNQCRAQGVVLHDALRIRLMDKLYHHYLNTFQSKILSREHPQGYYDASLAERCAHSLAQHLNAWVIQNQGLFLTSQVFDTALAITNTRFRQELEWVETLFALDPSHRGHFCLIETQFALHIKALPQDQLGPLVQPIFTLIDTILQATDEAQCGLHIDALNTLMSDLYHYPYVFVPRSYRSRAVRSIRNIHRDIRRILQSQSFKAILIGTSLSYLIINYFPQGLPVTWQGRLAYYATVALLSRPIRAMALLAEPIYFLFDEICAIAVQTGAYFNRLLRCAVLSVTGACYAYWMSLQPLTHLILLSNPWPLVGLHAYLLCTVMALSILVCRRLFFGGKLEEGRFRLTPQMECFLEVGAASIQHFFEHQTQYLSHCLKASPPTKAELFRVHELKQQLEAIWTKVRRCNATGLLRDWTVWLEDLEDLRESQIRKLQPELKLQLRHLTQALLAAQIKIAQCPVDAVVSLCHKAYQTQHGSRAGSSEPARYLHAFAVHQYRSTLDELKHAKTIHGHMLKRFQARS